MESIKQLALKKIANKTKPLGSLGMLEDCAVRLCEIQQTLDPCVASKKIVVFAGSHGVAEEGVSAFPAAVNEQMVLNFLSGGAGINVLAHHGGIQLGVVDVGVDSDFNGVESTFFTRRTVRRGTRNFAKEPAMTREECAAAMEAGREELRKAAAEGVQMVGTGEMGIANTTAASALFSALLGMEAGISTGRGTGIDNERLLVKTRVVREAVIRYRTIGDSEGPLGWLRAVGGLEIAAITGFILEAAQARVPVVVDGFISTAAATVALAINHACRQVIFFSHKSDEHAHADVLRRLNADPLLDLRLRLGEGTGAALAMHLLDASAKIMCEMASFESAGVSASESEP